MGNKEEVDLDRRVVYKRGQVIEGKYYIVEIAENERGMFITVFSMSD